MQRMKIESVSRFCKQELKWESPRIDDWQTMQNLLTFIYFVAGYFYEVEHELKNDPTVIWIAQLARSKGKVTPHFIIKGLGIIFLSLNQYFISRVQFIKTTFFD